MKRRDHLVAGGGPDVVRHNAAGVCFFSALVVLFLSAGVWAQDMPADRPVLDANAPATANLLEQQPEAPADAASRPIKRKTKAEGPRAIRQNSGTAVQWYQNGFVALGVVLLLITVIAWGVKRFGPKGQLGNSAIRVLSRSHLSPKQSLALIRVGDRVMLVGITPDRISHLTTFDDPVGVDVMTASASTKAVPGEAFGGHLDSESLLFQVDDDMAEHVASADLGTVRQTRRNLRNLLGRVQTLKETART